MIRPIVSETKRYGDYSKPGEFIYDRPFQWGSRRIGPDLGAREGGRQSSLWHWLHFEDPEAVSEGSGSVMPSYAHLLEAEMDFEAIAPHVRAAAYLGAPYSDEEIENSAEIARRQAESIAADIVAQGGPINTFESEQAVALIAYLQRVGTDLFKTEEPPEAEPPEAEQAAEVAVSTAPLKECHDQRLANSLDTGLLRFCRTSPGAVRRCICCHHFRHHAAQPRGVAPFRIDSVK